MKRSRKIQLYALVAIVLVALGVYVWRAREPRYEGRSVSEWLGDMGNARDEATILKAGVAIRALGTNALPTMIRFLRTEDGEIRKKLVEISGRQPFMVFKIDTALNRQIGAMFAFGALDATAVPAIPELTALLGDPNLNTAEFAARALSNIGPPATDALLGAITNAINRLGSFGTNAHAAMPALVRLKGDKTIGYAAYTLSELATEALEKINAVGGAESRGKDARESNR